MRTVALACLLGTWLLAGGCALFGGFDVTGYGPVPDAAAGGYAPQDAAIGTIDANGADGSGGSPAMGAMGVPDAAAGDGCVVDASSSCGVCGHDCQGGACVGGACQPVVLSPAVSPQGLAVDDANVYWVQGIAGSAGGSLLRIPVGGGPAVTMNSNSFFDYEGPIVLDSTNVYFTETRDVMSAFLLLNTQPSAYDDRTDPTQGLGAVAVDANNLYIVRNLLTVQGGGCPAIAIDVTPLKPTLPGTTWTSGICHVVHLAIDSENLYFTDIGTSNAYAHPAVWKQPIAGGDASVIAPSADPHGIAVYGGGLYWTDTVGSMTTGEVWKLALDGASIPAVLANSAAPAEMAVDGSGVYWIDSGGAILTVPLTGGPVRTLATGQTPAIAIATGRAAVFWLIASSDGADAGPLAGGAVMKLAK